MFCTSSHRGETRDALHGRRVHESSDLLASNNNLINDEDHNDKDTKTKKQGAKHDPQLLHDGHECFDRFSSHCVDIYCSGFSYCVDNRRRMNLLCDDNIIVNNNDMDDNNDKELQYMLSCLSQEELEIAARTSYHYLRHNTTSGSCSSIEQKKHAKAMARRYLESKKEVEKALQCMKDTLQFRQEMKLDRLVTIFDSRESNNDITPTSDDDSDEQFRSELKSMLSSKKNFVMGYDKQGRATFHFVLRQTQHHDPERTLLESIYTMERAIACSQQQLDKNSSESNPHEATTTPSINVTINAVVDCAGYNAWTQGPPLDVGQAFLQTLRQHYVGNFYRIFILDAPVGFAWLWKILSPLVGTSTRDKIVFLTGEEEKEAILQEYYNVRQAGPWMLVGGQMDRELDIDEYLFKIPFDRAFDECGLDE